MNDEELLRSLGTLAAEVDDDPVPEKWQRLLRGELSPEEVAGLERAAENDAETETLLAAYRPLDAGTREHITSDLAAHLPRGSMSAAAPTPIQAASRWRARAAALTSGIALAAGVAFFVAHGRQTDTLPAYTLDVRGAATSRGPADPAASVGGPCVLDARASGSFELLARTERTGGGTVGAQAFLVRDGEEPRPWPGALEVSASGSVRILDSVELLRGAGELRVVIARAPIDADLARDRARRGSASGAGWQVLTCAIQ